MSRILIVDDEPAVIDVVEFALRKAGFHVCAAGSIAAARDVCNRQPVDLVVLDLGLPDGDGMDLCRSLHESTRASVIILTCRDEEADRVVGLESGADDYVVKPFSPRELVARVRSVLRRVNRPSNTDARFALGSLVVDLRQHRTTLRGSCVSLTPLEFDLLATLVASPDRVFTRENLIERVYQGEVHISDRTIDSHVKGIRRRFAAVQGGGDPIETVFGVGYRARRLT